MRLAAVTPAAADSPRAAVVRASFDRLASQYGAGLELDVRIVNGPIVAECLHGRTIVANESLAEQPEGVRLFVLAHEIGHAVLGHWDKLAALYQRHIPGAVVPENTDPVAGALGREASQLSHEHELEADAFAYSVIRALGYDLDTAFAVLRLQGVQADTATHPGTRKRLAHLRSLH
jgi:Zn-dependent protease with chaperone function